MTAGCEKSPPAGNNITCYLCGRIIVRDDVMWLSDVPAGHATVFACACMCETLLMPCFTEPLSMFSP